MAPETGFFTGRVLRASPGQACIDGPFGSGTPAGVPLTTLWSGTAEACPLVIHRRLAAQRERHVATAPTTAATA